MNAIVRFVDKICTNFIHCSYLSNLETLNELHFSKYFLFKSCVDNCFENRIQKIGKIKVKKKLPEPNEKIICKEKENQVFASNS